MELVFLVGADRPGYGISGLVENQQCGGLIDFAIRLMDFEAARPFAGDVLRGWAGCWGPGLRKADGGKNRGEQHDGGGWSCMGCTIQLVPPGVADLDADESIDTSIRFRWRVQCCTQFL